MQNAVLAPAANDDPVAARAAERALAGRRTAYAEEVRRLIDAGSAVMRRTGSIDPKVSDIVGEAGLSNQAFYRHFRSKDELLLAILDDGLERLVGYLEHRMATTPDPLVRVRRWIEGIFAQAADPTAAEATRPFAVDGARLRDRFPEESARSVAGVKAPLVAAIRDARASGAAPGADPARDADAIYHLAMGCTNQRLVDRAAPTKRDVTHVVEFALAAITRTSRRGA